MILSFPYFKADLKFPWGYIWSFKHYSNVFHRKFKELQEHNL